MVCYCSYCGEEIYDPKNCSEFCSIINDCACDEYNLKEDNYGFQKWCKGEEEIEFTLILKEIKER